ncbi:MAG: type II toxin-antitoxin system VapC family toxin [Acidobacteriota bacterium]|nr:type II toxin-antitoxin system VapC family toxin [Blastocatellia bacterium]MDW8240578.1 type II toxin-antitoxin system VapC family toxin [Acidobacteriota bacterium]
MSVYVTDTHPLIWYASGKHGQLSKKVLAAFQAAWRGKTLIYVPVFVLWEIAMLLKVRCIALREPYGDWVEHLIAQRGFDLAPTDTRTITEAYAYPFPDPFDSVITATAKVMDLPLITKDETISDSQLVDIYW